MFTKRIRNLKSMLMGLMGLLMVSTFSGLYSSTTMAQAVNQTLPFFNGALQVKVIGPNSLSSGSAKTNTFTVQINDSTGKPYAAITKKWVKASVEMTSMDMGVTPVSSIEDVLDANKQLQGKLAMNPTFSMRGPWLMKITITVSGADGRPMSDTKSVTFNVTK